MNFVTTRMARNLRDVWATIRESYIKDLSIYEDLPYSHCDTMGGIHTHGGDTIRVYEIRGYPNTVADREKLNAAHRALCNYFQGLESKYGEVVSFWSYMFREKANYTPKEVGFDDFAGLVISSYEREIARKAYGIRYVFCVVIRGDSKLGNSYRARNNKEREALRVVREEHDNLVGEVDQTTLSSLSDFGIRPVVPRMDEAGFCRLDPAAVLYRLINGYWMRPLQGNGYLSDLLPTSRALFSDETIWHKAPDDRCERFSAILHIKSVPRQLEGPQITFPGMLNDLLSVNTDFVVVNSAGYISRSRTLSEYQRILQRRTVNKNQGSRYLVDLADATDKLASSDFSLMSHCCSIVVTNRTPKGLEAGVTAIFTLLKSHGYLVVRSDSWTLYSDYLSCMPGIFKARMPLPVTSANLAAFICPYHPDRGQRNSKRFWGRPLATFLTDRNTVCDFDPFVGTHASALIFGRPDAGKSVLMGYFLCCSKMYDTPPTRIMFDKDQASRLLVLADPNGRYLSAPDTRANPFLLENTPNNVSVVSKIVVTCLESQDGKLTIDDRAIVETAVGYVFEKQRELRRFRSLASYFKNGSELHTRLQRWIGDGKYAYVFDNDEDNYNFDRLENGSTPFIGVNMARMIAVREIGEPYLLYLLHRISEIIDGRPIILAIEEAWSYFANPAIRDLLEDWVRHGRSRNLLITLTSQDIRSAYESEIGRLILGISPTILCFGDSTLDLKITRLLGFTDREYEVVHDELTGKRAFLVKQRDLRSSVLTFDLSASPQLFKILSGRTENNTSRDELCERLGTTDPAIWVPEFLNS